MAKTVALGQKRHLIVFVAPTLNWGWKAFSNAIVGGSCPSEYAEYFMAHQLKGDMRKTYSEMDDAEWLQIYQEYQPDYLSFRILPLEVAQREFKKLTAAPTVSS